MRKYVVCLAGLIIAISVAFGGGIGRAQGPTNAARTGCKLLPSWGELRAALVAARNEANGGLNLDMWGTIVDRDGVVCAVAFTGTNRDDQWPGSRVISAQKANTANAFSLPWPRAVDGQLFTAVQPGGSLFGLQESNPVSPASAYGGNPEHYGKANDPMVGERIGGVNVFGGGLALYNSYDTLRRRRRRQRRYVVRGSQHRLPDARRADRSTTCRPASRPIRCARTTSFSTSRRRATACRSSDRCRA